MKQVLSVSTRRAFPMGAIFAALICAAATLLALRVGFSWTRAQPRPGGVPVISFTPTNQSAIDARNAATGSLWSPRGVGGGGAMYSPTINPLNPNELYVACDMSPQFHTTDLGKSWATVDFRMLQSSHESAVRFTRDPNILWTIDYSPKGGADTARPSRSTDGGKTWQPLPEASWPASRQAYRLFVDYDNPERALISAEYRELWITLDGGQTFEKKLSIPGDVGLHLAGAFFDGRNIYACLGDGILASSDGGQNFTRMRVNGLPAGSFISSFAGARARGRTRFFCVVLRQGWA